jgi:hypothetical protein
MLVRPFALALFVAILTLSAPAAEPAVTVHKDVPAALKEAKALRVPAIVMLTKAKAAVPAATTNARVVQTSRSIVCCTALLTPALAKQYELDGEAHVLILDENGAVKEKFAADVTADKVIEAVNTHAKAARKTLLDSAGPDADAKAKKVALAGLTRLGPVAEDLLPFLTDRDATIRDTARKALAAMPPEAAAHALMGALKSEDSALRAAVHPLAVQATGYKGAPLTVFQSGTAEEREDAWKKWNEHVQSHYPPLNQALLAYCERHMGEQVNNGECAMLVVEGYREISAKPMVRSGETYVWGRLLKSGEPVLPGDVVQFEKAKFTSGSAPHHTAVVRKVLAPGKYELLEQNAGGVKKVRVGKLDMSTLKEGTVEIYRPQPK